MTIEVETGSGSATAESFASVADCDTYFANRGLTNWTILTTGEKEQALRRATDYMQQTYRDSWTGLRTSGTQALDWPRWSVPVRDLPGGYGTGNAYFANNAVPAEVKSACIMLAIKAAAGELAPDLSSQVASVKVGPIEKTYFPGTRQQVKYQAVDHLLAPFLADSTRLTRA